MQFSLVQSQNLWIGSRTWANVGRLYSTTQQMLEPQRNRPSGSAGCSMGSTLPWSAFRGFDVGVVFYLLIGVPVAILATGTPITRNLATRTSISRKTATPAQNPRNATRGRQSQRKSGNAKSKTPPTGFGLEPQFPVLISPRFGTPAPTHVCDPSPTRHPVSSTPFLASTCLLGMPRASTSPHGISFLYLGIRTM